MSTARVTSIEALREFRAYYLMFCDEAKDALSTADVESRRMQEWVHYQAQHWKNKIRECEENVSQAKNALFRKKITKTVSGRPPDVIEEQKALARAQAELQHAHEKLAKCKHWAIELPRAIGEYQGPARQMAGQVEGELPHAVFALDKILDTLDKYTQLAPRAMPRVEEPARKTPAAGFASRGVEVPPAEEPAKSLEAAPKSQEEKPPEAKTKE